MRSDDEAFCGFIVLLLILVMGGALGYGCKRRFFPSEAQRDEEQKEKAAWTVCNKKCDPYYAMSVYDGCVCNMQMKRAP